MTFIFLSWVYPSRSHNVLSKLWVDWMIWISLYLLGHPLKVISQALLPDRTHSYLGVQLMSSLLNATLVVRDQIIDRLGNLLLNFFEARLDLSTVLVHFLNERKSGFMREKDLRLKLLHLLKWFWLKLIGWTRFWLFSS